MTKENQETTFSAELLDELLSARPCEGLALRRTGWRPEDSVGRTDAERRDEIQLAGIVQHHSDVEESPDHMGHGQGPIEYSPIEKLVEKVLKPLGKVVPPLSRIKTADTVEDFPDGDGGETHPRVGDPVEKPGNPRFRFRPHHLRDGVRIEKTGDGRGNVSFLSVKSTCLKA